MQGCRNKPSKGDAAELCHSKLGSKAGDIKTLWFVKQNHSQTGESAHFIPLSMENAVLLLGIRLCAPYSVMSFPTSWNCKQ